MRDAESLVGEGGKGEIQSIHAVKSVVRPRAFLTLDVVVAGRHWGGRCISAVNDDSVLSVLLAQLHFLPIMSLTMLSTFARQKL